MFYTSKKAGKAFEVSRWIICPLGVTGRGRSDASRFYRLLNMPISLQNRAYKGHESCLNFAAKEGYL